MRRVTGCLIVALLAVLAIDRPATADESFVVGVENVGYLPAYTTENGVYGGFAREVLDRYAADRHYKFDYRPLPVLRLFASFFAGDVDFKFPDDQDWQPDMRAGKTVTYSHPVADYVDGTSVLAGKLNRPLNDIHSLGTVTGFTPWAWQERIAANQVTLTENANFTALIQQVLSGRIDAAYANVAVIQYQLTNVSKQPGALTFDDSLPYVRGSYRLSTIKHPEVIADFNRWLAEHDRDVRQLKEKFGVENGLSR
jgi:ABC-type amino acid transport substrate-binding protein